MTGTTTATLRLFWIEIRRSVGLWCFPFLVALAWFASRLEEWEGPTLWTVTSKQIASALILLAPAAGGLAAWAAGRDRRRGIEDLLQTTPRPTVQRDLVGLGASTLWTLLACLAVAGYLVIVAMRQATWGGPLPAPIAIGLLTLVTSSTAGFVAGLFVPSRFTPPLAAVGLFLALAAPTAAPYRTSSETGLLVPSPLIYLSPWAITQEVSYSVFRQPAPDIAGRQALWLIALGAVAIAALLLRRGRTTVVWTGLVAALTVAALAAGLLLTADTNLRNGAETPYVPVCVQHAGSIPVCIHPAYESQFNATAASVDGIMRPILDLPGTPARAEQLGEGMSGFTSDGTWAIDPDLLTTRFGSSTLFQVLNFVRDPSKEFFDPLAPDSSVQAAIAVWLLRQADFDVRAETLPTPLELDGNGTADGVAPAAASTLAAIDAAVARFAALALAAQRAWLEENWTNLRAGRLTLDDLP